MTGSSAASSPVVVYGGSFDPVHLGHLNVAREVLAQKRAERVIFLPAARSPHKAHQRVTAPEHRLRMVQFAVADLPGCEVSDFEIQSPPPSYTVNSARHFHELYGERLHLLLGMDSVQELHRWYRVSELLALCKLIIYRRPGSALPDFEILVARFGAETARQLCAGIIDGPELAVSATEIRERIGRHESIAGLVPEPVATYIAAHQLYRD